MVQENFLQNLGIENKKDLIKQIDSFLNDYSNEIPIEIIHGNKKENLNYKVRGNWFTGVLNFLENAEEFFPENFNLEYRQFFKSFKQRRGGMDDIRTIKEEIDIADGFLIRAKEYIEKSL